MSPGETGGAPAPAPAPVGFTVRRLPKPNYRPPTALARNTRAGTPLPMAVDNLHTQVIHRRDGGLPLTEWQMGAQEEVERVGAIGVEAAGRSRLGSTEILGGRAFASRRSWSLTAGDLPAPDLRSIGSLMRLRGASLGHTRPDGRGWAALVAVAAPGANLRAEPTALSLLSADGVRVRGGRAAFTLAGFARWRPPRPAGTPPRTRTEYAGRGGSLTTELRTAPGRDLVALSLGAQLHDLEGHDAPAALQRLECRIVRPTVALALLEQRASRQARSFGNERLARAAARDDRLTAQWRPLRGRAEMHAAAVAATGEGLLPATRNAGLGGSCSLGPTAWFVGADGNWRAAESAAPPTRRLALRTGRFGSAAGSVLLQIEQQRQGHAPAALFLTGQGSTAVPAGLRLTLEPRLGWTASQLQNLDFGLGLSWGRAGSLTRLSGTLTLGGTRDAGFACGVREAAIRLAFAPRLRDRGSVEVRRLADAAAPAWEYETDYDLQGRRYLPGSDVAARSWTASVRVLVTRASDGAAVPEVLVSLDGRRLAFTAADGTAEFERVEPGIHVVGIEERSLPRGLRAMQTTQILVTVEKGRPLEPVRIEVGRAGRKTEF